MSATTTEKPVLLGLGDAYTKLCKALNEPGNDPKNHQRINHHIRAISGKLLIQYHNDSSIPEANKVATYRSCFTAIIKKDWATRLQGQGTVGNGDKRAEAEAAEAAPVMVADKLVTEKKVATPATTQESPPEPQNPTMTETNRTVKPEVDEAQQLINIIRRLKGPGTATLDNEKVVDLVADRLAAFERAYTAGLGELIKQHNANGAFPVERVTNLFQELSQGLAHRIEFVTGAGEVKTLEGLVHPQVSQVAAWLKAGVPVWIWGGAGGGKTQAARQVAELLAVEPQVVSIDPTITVSKLMGYRNVTNGEFVEGFIYKTFKGGGLLALDEIDTGDPGVIAATNSLLSNGHYLFPNNETVIRNDQFYTLAMANTKGMGAVAGYTARNRLDAATLDRFAIIEFKYDEGLEMAVACGVGQPSAPWKPGSPATVQDQMKFVQWVQKLRAAYSDNVLTGPRSSINGCKALRAGIPIKEVVDAVVLKLVTPDTYQRILADHPLPL